MKRMLVTGAAGFIGANFVRYWRNAHPQDHIVIVDALTYAGNTNNLTGALDDRCQLVVTDINNTDEVMVLLRDQSLDTIVHFAAESHVDRSIDVSFCSIQVLCAVQESSSRPEAMLTMF